MNRSDSVHLQMNKKDLICEYAANLEQFQRAKRAGVAVRNMRFATIEALHSPLSFDEQRDFLRLAMLYSRTVRMQHIEVPYRTSFQVFFSYNDELYNSLHFRRYRGSIGVVIVLTIILLAI